MNYDSVLIELLGRVQELERQVKELKNKKNDEIIYDESICKKISTEDIYKHIMQQKENARERGDESIILRAGDIEKETGLKNRIPMVVNAMKRAMNNMDDEIISSPSSGFSTSVAIKYNLRENSAIGISAKGGYNKFIIRKAASPKSMKILNLLQVIANREHILVFDNDERCVGVVFAHYEKRGSAANGQAEICFFDEYFNLYGKWHRMYIGGRKGSRLMFSNLENMLAEKQYYEYSGYIAAR